MCWVCLPAAKANGGAPGVDGQTLRGHRGRTAWSGGWTNWRKNSGRRRTSRRPVRRVYIPKPDGKQRPLGIPTIRDRVVQTAAVLVLEPIFEADLQPEQYAYRPERSALDAVQPCPPSAQHGASPGRGRCRLVRLLRQHSACGADAVAGSSHQRSAHAAADQAVAGDTGRRGDGRGGRRRRQRPGNKDKDAAPRKGRRSRRC